MKRTLLYAAVILGLLASPSLLSAQCTPGDETTCPDLENNGEICPEMLPNAILDEPYLQEFTILAPPEYVLDSSAGIVVSLPHLTIKSIDNMPPGLSWESNAADSVFMVGTYYCVLLEGTPTQKGSFPLKIVVDVYVPGILGSPPIYVATVTDSTSLAITVSDANAVDDHPLNFFNRLICSPNPFSNEVEITFNNPEPGSARLEVYTIMGKQVHAEALKILQGENRILFKGEDLMTGVYFITLRDSQGAVTRRIVKTN